jgi:hypothetical protein
MGKRAVRGVNTLLDKLVRVAVQKWRSVEFKDSVKLQVS